MADCNEAIRPLHDRMPVLLHPHEYEQWLRGSFEDLLAFQNRCFDLIEITAVTAFPRSAIVATSICDFLTRPRGRRCGMVCPNCKAENPDGSKFCARCGTVLAAGSSPSAAIVPSTSSAEPRQLTVMLCDLVRSTAASGRLDPEDLRQVLVAYHTYVTETLTLFGGFLAADLRGRGLGYFGYPQALAPA